MHRRTMLLAGAAICVFALSASAQTTPKRVRGTIRSLDGNTLTVAANDGEMVKVVLAPNYTVGAIVPSSLDKVKPGAMIGIVGFGPPKEQRAAVISIFPAGATVAEAQFPWDSQPDSVMTNAPIVSEVPAEDGRTLTVTVKGEPIKVTVPANAIVQETEPGTPAMLAPRRACADLRAKGGGRDGHGAAGQCRQGRVDAGELSGVSPPGPGRP